MFKNIRFLHRHNFSNFYSKKKNNDTWGPRLPQSPHCKPIPCNKNRGPCNENRGSLYVMKTGFSLGGKLHRENPVLALYWPCTGLQCLYYISWMALVSSCCSLCISYSTLSFHAFFLICKNEFEQNVIWYLKVCSRFQIQVRYSSQSTSLKTTKSKMGPKFSSRKLIFLTFPACF